MMASAIVDMVFRSAMLRPVRQTGQGDAMCADRQERNPVPNSAALGQPLQGMGATLYFDESGNTGINYVDPHQPVFVMAGWLVRDDQRGILERAVATVRALYPDSPEVSASLVLGTPVGQARAAHLLRELIAAGVQPVYALAEKRHAVVAKFVDVFFDPFHNDRAKWLPNSAFAARRELVHAVSQVVDDNWVNRFARAYRRPLKEEFLDVLADWLPLATQLGPQVESATRGAIASIEIIVDAETYDSDAARHYEYASLNTPFFLHCARMANDMLKVHDMSAELVFDETETFGAVFAEVLRIFHNGGIDKTIFADGAERGMTTGRIRTWRSGKSELEPGIQAADVLAGVLAKATRQLLAGNPIPQALAEISKYLLAMPLLGPPNVAMVMCSENLEASVAQLAYSVVTP